MLVAFGVAILNLVSARRFTDVDAQLQTRVSALRKAISQARHLEPPPPPFGEHRDSRPPSPPTGPPPDLFGPLPGPPRPGNLPKSFTIPPEATALFGPQAGFYFEIVSQEGAILQNSGNAPASIPKPSTFERDSLPHFRIWSTYRELIHCSGVGDCVIVGRSVADELRNATAMAWLIPLAGATVLLVGLIVGWWIVNRSVRPVQLIEATADEIRSGNLSARVPIGNSQNELGQLSSSLNDTFARLQTTLERQKQFTSDAAHELRTPLTVMISEAQTTLARPRNASEYQEALEGCLQAAQEMRRLTDTLLDLARLDLQEPGVQKTEIDLQDVAAACMQRLQLIAQNHSVALKGDLAPAIVFGVAERMSLVAANMILNAICYNRPGGEVLVRTWNDNGRSMLSVADSGIGIATADLPRIFDRFYRADKARSREGGHAGLGLSICKAIVEHDGGAIQVESEIGKGTLFVVDLPRYGVRL